MAINYIGICFIKLAPEANPIKIFWSGCGSAAEEFLKINEKQKILGSLPSLGRNKIILSKFTHSFCEQDHFSAMEKMVYNKEPV
jgi:hypothetical protein